LKPPVTNSKRILEASVMGRHHGHRKRKGASLWTFMYKTELIKVKKVGGKKKTKDVAILHPDGRKGEKRRSKSGPCFRGVKTSGDYGKGPGGKSTFPLKNQLRHHREVQIRRHRVRAVRGDH